MKWLILVLIPATLWAQDFPFEQEFNTIPVEIDNWYTIVPWTYGLAETTPCFIDIDADGDSDLFIGDFIGYISYYENCGSPNLADFSYVTSALDSIQTLPDGGHNCPEFCDIDGDGDFDLFTGGGYVGLYYNEGSPESFWFGAVDTLKDINLNNILGWHISLVDIDADGDYDLFNGHYQGDIYFYRNVGNEYDYSFYLEDENWEGIDVGNHADLTFCDIDADGDYDLFVGNDMGYIWYYQNDGDSANWNFADPVINWLGIDVGDHASPEFCDIDGDGDFDLFVGREPYLGNVTNGDVFFYENIGTPSVPDFRYVTSNYLTIDVGDNTNLQLLDIDADGDYDLFVSDQGDDGIWYFQNVGSPNWPVFAEPVLNWQGIPIEASIQRYLRFYDIDEDGDLDLFFYNNWDEWGGNNLRYSQNIGMPQSPFMQLVTRTYLPEEVYCPVPWFCDIDFDGFTDFFVGDLYGGILFFHGIDTIQVVIPPAQRHPLAGTHLTIGPNPANPVTFITFPLPYPQEATLAVYNLLGARVTTLTSGLQPPGTQSFLWDARGKASGVYIVRLDAAGEVQAEMLVVVK